MKLILSSNVKGGISENFIAEKEFDESVRGNSVTPSEQAAL